MTRCPVAGLSVSSGQKYPGEREGLAPRPGLTARATPAHPGAHEKSPATRAGHEVDARDVRPQAPAVLEKSVGAIGHFGADLLAQDVDRHGLAVALEAPVGPAVAAWRAFEGGADLMDRALDVIADQRAVGAHLGLVTPVHAQQFLARAQHAALDQLAEGHARFGAFRGRHLKRRAVEFA